jgi:hypothetical protein
LFREAKYVNVARFNLFMNLMWMVKAKNIEIGNFQKITKNVDIKNINELKILYMEVNKVDNLLR